MASLKIYNEIVNEEDKVFLQDWLGVEAVCYRDIADFLDKIPEDDGDIELRLHCPGGDVMEGWAIYDALRQSGKTITATIEGQCSSMATVILLAAPKERRFATQNASMCIHNPYIPYMDLWINEDITADKMDNLAAKIKAESSQLREQQQKILDLYVERTGSSAEELQALMNENKFVGMDKAKELGFISDTLAPNTDKTNKSKTGKMNKNEVTVKASVLSRMLAKLGLAKIEDFKVVDMVVTAANGDELTVEREEGDPQVGDVASPDGEFVMDDGTTIVVANGTISEIKPKEEEQTQEDEKDQKIADLTAQVADLTAQITTLTAEKDAAIADSTAKDQKITDLTASQKSEEEVAILDKVNNAGGMSWLEGILAMKSTFNKTNTKFVTHEDGNKNEEEEKTIGANYLAAKKERARLYRR